MQNLEGYKATSRADQQLRQQQKAELAKAQEAIAVKEADLVEIRQYIAQLKQKADEAEVCCSQDTQMLS